MDHYEYTLCKKILTHSEFNCDKECTESDIMRIIKKYPSLISYIQKEHFSDTLYDRINTEIYKNISLHYDSDAIVEFSNYFNASIPPDIILKYEYAFISANIGPDLFEQIFTEIKFVPSFNFCKYLISKVGWVGIKLLYNNLQTNLFKTYVYILALEFPDGIFEFLNFKDYVSTQMYNDIMLDIIRKDSMKIRYISNPTDEMYYIVQEFNTDVQVYTCIPPDKINISLLIQNFDTIVSNGGHKYLPDSLIMQLFYSIDKLSHDNVIKFILDNMNLFTSYIIKPDANMSISKYIPEILFINGNYITMSHILSKYVDDNFITYICDKMMVPIMEYILNNIERYKYISKDKIDHLKRRMCVYSIISDIDSPVNVSAVLNMLYM